ncbi:hypothetical protein [Brumimicrobium mesophilum]|uniref:hypothetical protein n=1 Tax=Brumimicrobium mesophilum TaxID=392717 RepID=UPI000D14021D|nr:hypothetical protein [Brumimicrobium mesophilum]
MTFKHSNCYPDKENIEYPSTVLDTQQVLELFKKHPWKEQNELCLKLPEEKIHFSPSIGFTNTNSKHGLELTAHEDDGKLSFSLWFNRPKKVKVLFGILGEYERMQVDDVWGFNLDESILYLTHFVNGNYSVIEELYKR